MLYPIASVMAGIMEGRADELDIFAAGNAGTVAFPTHSSHFTKSCA